MKCIAASETHRLRPSWRFRGHLQGPSRRSGRRSAAIKHSIPAKLKRYVVHRPVPARASLVQVGGPWYIPLPGVSTGLARYVLQDSGV